MQASSKTPRMSDVFRGWFEETLRTEKQFLFLPRSVCEKIKDTSARYHFWGKTSPGWYRHPITETLEAIERGDLTLFTLLEPGETKPHLDDTTSWAALHGAYRFTRGNTGQLLFRDGAVGEYLYSEIRVSVGKYGTEAYYMNEEGRLLILIRMYTSEEITKLVRHAVESFHALRRTNPRRALRIARMAISSRPRKESKESNHSK